MYMYYYIHIYSPHIVPFPTKTIYDPSPPPIHPPQGKVLYITVGFWRVLATWWLKPVKIVVKTTLAKTKFCV